MKKRKPKKRALKKRRGRKYRRTKGRAPKFRKIECQLGQAALRYARAKGFLSRVEKGMSKSENPGGFKIYFKGRNHYFKTLEAAREAANDFFSRTKVVLAIEKDSRRRKR